MPPNVLATMVTTTSYGTWLPGDARGYVDRGRILSGDPEKLEVGMDMEFTFRKFHEGSGFHNYSWKLQPVRC